MSMLGNLRLVTQVFYSLLTVLPPKKNKDIYIFPYLVSITQCTADSEALAEQGGGCLLPTRLHATSVPPRAVRSIKQRKVPKGMALLPSEAHSMDSGVRQAWIGPWPYLYSLHDFGQVA